MTLMLAILFLAAGGVTFFVLVRFGYTETIDVVGWVGATLCTIGGLMTAAGYIAEHGIGISGDNARQVATFIVIVVALAAGIVGALQLARRQRVAEFDTEPVASRSNYVPRQAQVHAYGTYTRADVQAERRKAQQIRKGAHA